MSRLWAADTEPPSGLCPDSPLPRVAAHPTPHSNFPLSAPSTINFHRMTVFAFLVAFVGLGSAAFHGSLLFHTQLLDELPMICT